MINIGIEAMNVFGGSAYLEVLELAKLRNLDNTRFENLMMNEKTVALPYEDPITFGVNACKPIIDSLSEEDKNRIELLITCTESGIDFGKSISTYIHNYLGLSRNCRMFEIKNACYSGTAGLQMAVSFVLSQASPGAKALVVSTDISRFMAVEKGQTLDWDLSFTEPSSGAGAIAMLISEKPKVFQMDIGACGYYGYEVMDTCRPVPDCDAGDADLSLLSYLDCFEQAFLEYQRRVADVDYKNTFQYLVFHVPFGGMVKGAHRTMMRRLYKSRIPEADDDFDARVMPGIQYSQRVGNIMGASVLLSLISTIDNGTFESAKRLGCFSYGSGCCSEFFSGVATPSGQEILRSMDISRQLDKRYKLNMEEYKTVISGSSAVKFGTRNVTLDTELIPGLLSSRQGSGQLILERINEFHREYRWI